MRLAEDQRKIMVLRRDSGDLLPPPAKQDTQSQEKRQHPDKTLEPLMKPRMQGLLVQSQEAAKVLN